jgi:hypothetical protein
VTLTTSDDRVQAEIIQRLLGEAGIATVVEPAFRGELGVGGPQPDYLEGPQRVMVRAAWVDQARRLLEEMPIAEGSAQGEVDPATPSAGPRDGEEMVQVAFAKSPVEAGMLQGLLESGGIRSLVRPTGISGEQVGYGVLYAGYGGGGQRIMVWASEADAARALLADTLVAEEQDELDWAEIANARHLERAEGRRPPRNYGLVGAYGRIYLVSFGVLVAAFVVFLLLRAL